MEILPHYEMDDLKNDIGIDPCQHIIQDDPETSFHSFKTTDRRWFENIEDPKEKESDDD